MISMKELKEYENFPGLQGILVLRHLFGYYFQSSNSLIMCLLFKCYCVVCCGILTYGLYFWNNYNYSLSYDMLVVLEKAVGTVISLITEEEFVIKFASDIVTYFSPSLQIRLYCRMTNFMVCIAIAIRAINKFAFWSPITINEVLYMYELTSCYFSRLTAVYIAENYQKMVEVLWKSLRDKMQSTSNIDVKRKYVKDFIFDLRKLTDILDATVIYLRVQVIVGCICEFFKVTFAMFYLNYANVTTRYSVIWTAEVIFSIITFLVPLIMIELGINYLIEIKNVLAEEFLASKDKELRGAITDALEYVEACASKHMVWNEFPMNLDLVLGYFNLCTDYVIAILQFIY